MSCDVMLCNVDFCMLFARCPCFFFFFLRWSFRKQIGKRIEKIIVLSSFSQLLVLVDSNLVLLDKDNFEGRPLSGLKGVSLVHEDAFHPDNTRLLVCSKKKVQVRVVGVGG